MSIREVLVKEDCSICDGKEYGCYDCNGKGYIKKWIPMTEFINSMKFTIEHGKGIA
jgi:hypothetical protein